MTDNESQPSGDSKRASPLRRIISRWAGLFLLGALSYGFAGLYGVMGLAPEDVVPRLIGEDIRSVLENLVPQNLDPNAARWTFVVVSVVLFVLGTLLFLLIPVMKGRAELKQIRKDLQKIEIEYKQNYEEVSKMRDDIDKKARDLLKKTTDRLRGIKRIHNNTYKMLKEIREKRDS